MYSPLIECSKTTDALLAECVMTPSAHITPQGKVLE